MEVNDRIGLNFFPGIWNTGNGPFHDFEIGEIPLRNSVTLSRHNAEAEELPQQLNIFPGLLKLFLQPPHYAVKA